MARKRGGLIVFACLLFTACNPAVNNDGPVAPDTLSAAASLSASCSGCHIAGSAVPTLNGWKQSALKERLDHYQDKSTGDSVMHRFARGLSDDDIASISAYLGTQS